MTEPHPHDVLASTLGGIDVYLLDQIVKGRLRDRSRVLDAGCGSGRNLLYLLRSGHDVCGVDPDAARIATLRERAAVLRPDLPPERFQVGRVEEVDLGPEESFDVVISNAVLHFAESVAAFESILMGSWRYLAPGGLFFCRLASTIGIEEHVTPLGEGQFQLGDGSQRFLVTQDDLLRWTRDLGGRLIEPIKTTNVQNLRAMTTWVLERD